VGGGGYKKLKKQTNIGVGDGCYPVVLLLLPHLVLGKFLKKIKNNT
jgi:hypothetical protein